MRRLAIAALALAACGSPSRDVLVMPFDAGLDAQDAAPPPTDGSQDDPTLGGPCQEDAQCDDQVACTSDKCDPTLLRCRNTPDDSLCDDTVYCNGKERCLLKPGCGPGPVVTCATGKACDINSCVEADKSCLHKPRDADGDGDPDDHCVAQKDCNDQDPNVASTHSEVCNNGVDDNCNGVKDEQPCSSAANATCPTALPIGGPGTYQLDTAAAAKTLATSCSVTNPAGGHDVVAAVTIGQGGAKDLDVWATAPGGTEVSVAIQGTCGQSGSELACVASAGSTTTHARGRNLAPGTYYVVLTASKETLVELSVDLLAPTPKAPNEDCASASPITPGVATNVALFDATKDLPSSCTSATGELTYAFTLAQPRAVRVFANTLRGAGSLVTGLRSPSCSGQTDELRCRNGSTLPLFARALAAGTYTLTVSATSPIDASVLVETYAPTAAPPDQTCTTAPPASIDKTLAFDLTDHEDAIKDGCFPGAPTAAYTVDLPVPSDVLLVARFPQTEVGAVSFDAPGCTTVDRLLCAAAYTPVRVSKRNVPAGSYRAVVADTFAQPGSLTTLVRPTVVATAVAGADDCNTFIDVPPSGGFLTGDTTSMTANFDESCDVANSGPGGAADQVLRLVLTQTKRVVLSMDGSTYDTILSFRQGSTCPGIELKNGCNFSFSGARSFLDTTVAAGTYWIIVDGFAGSKGPWNLDVRVVDP